MAVILPRTLLSTTSLDAGLRFTPSSRRPWKVSRKDFIPVTPQEGSKPGFHSSDRTPSRRTVGHAPDTSGTACVRGVTGGAAPVCGSCAKAQVKTIRLRPPRMAVLRVENVENVED